VAIGNTPEFSPGQQQSEQLVVHVVWMTSGLGCDGDTLAMTAATQPSLEDLLRRAIPGMPGIVLHNPVLAYESCDEFMRAWHDAEAGELDPFIMVLEGSVPNEHLSGEGHWSGLGTDPDSGQPITVCSWLDRLAPRAATVLAVGTCACYGGVPAMRNNPTGAMGLRDYLGPGWETSTGRPIVNLPGCPTQPDNITETLLYLVLEIAGMTPPIQLDDQGRPTWLFHRTVQEGCSRAGYVEQGEFATEHGADTRCMVKLGCMGPVAKCNVPLRGWTGGVGGCPNVGGLCIGCTMPGFPDHFMPFMKPALGGRVAAAGAGFVYGPIVKYMRDRRMRRRYDAEPGWRRKAQV
jgi:hydrogenase small subunit